jgi:hypothetical protein
MPLDPQAQAYLDQMAALNMPQLHTLTPEQIREAIARRVDTCALESVCQTACRGQVGSF